MLVQNVKSVFALISAAMTVYIFSASPLYEYMRRACVYGVESGRMKNVTVEAYSPELFPAARDKEITETPSPAPTAAVLAALPTESAARAAYAEDNTVSAVSVTESESGETTILETTIEGGLAIKNQTGYKAEIGQLLVAGPALTLPSDGPQVLIIHTHSSEAYTQAGLDKYEASDEARTEDTQYNIVRVGDELAAVLESAGLEVIHDRGIYDYPSYTGSYTRSGQATEAWLAEYPSIRVVFDIHRDALGANGTVYKTMAEEEGVCASQAMLLVGTDESGLTHADWRQNLSLAVYLQQAVLARHPTLMRPVQLVPQRYNQHLCPGSLILEVGSSGNTLQEALAAVRLFGASAGEALCALIEQG